MDAAVRSILKEAVKVSSKSREEIVDQMSYLVGRDIDVTMLNSYIAETKRQFRFPLAWINAFCFVTGDYRLLAIVVERAGFRMVTAAEADVARKYLDREEAERGLKRATEAAIDERSKR